VDTQKEIELLKKQNQFLYKELLEARNNINALYYELDRLQAPHLKRNQTQNQLHPLYIRGEVDEKRFQEEWENL